MLSERYEEAIKTVHNGNTFKCTEILKENETNKTTGSRKIHIFCSMSWKVVMQEKQFLFDNNGVILVYE